MKKRLLYLTLIAATLSIGVIVGTIVSGGVNATAGQDKAATLSLPDPVALSNVFSQIAAQIDGAVVRIDIETVVPVTPPRGGGRGGRGGQNPAQPSTPETRILPSVGTGFIVDKAGYILTNHHVVEDATKIEVVLGDTFKPIPAKLIGSDKKTDLAVIKIEVAHDLPVAKLGNSDAVRTGDWVLAIGSPFGFDHTVTAGIISAKGRAGDEVGSRDPNGDPNSFQSFLQTDAAINPGNSGGPLVSMSGEVIGVNTAIITQSRGFSGLGFALPSNTALNVYNQLVTAGKVTRGSIGISYNPDPDPALLRPFGQNDGGGVLIEAVLTGKPAAKAGLVEGDIITQIDGKKILNSDVLLDIIANTPVGRTLQVKFMRGGREMTVAVVVGDRAEIIPDAEIRVPVRPGNAAPSQSGIGIGVQPVTAQMMRQFALSSQEGAAISSVETGSAAEDAGFGVGWIITQIVAGGQKTEIRTVEDYNNAVKSFKSGTELAIRVLSRNLRNEVVLNFVPITVP